MNLLTVGSFRHNLLPLNFFQESAEPLNSNDQGFFRRILSVNDVYVLENLMGFPMNNINLCVKIFFHMVDRYPTHEVRIILKIYVLFERKFFHFTLRSADNKLTKSCHQKGSFTMKTILIALALSLSLSVFADHHEDEEKTGHDKEHSHVKGEKKDHDHDDEHHKKHDHKAHHPEHKDEEAPKKKK